MDGGDLVECMECQATVERAVLVRIHGLPNYPPVCRKCAVEIAADADPSDWKLAMHGLNSVWRWRRGLGS